MIKFLNNLFNGRINRRSYFIGSLIVALIGGLIFLLLGNISPLINTAKTSDWLIVLFAYIVILGNIIPILLILPLSVRRWHDIGFSGWLAVFNAIPLLNYLFWLFLVIKKGKERNNKYGKKPLPRINFYKDILGQR